MAVATAPLLARPRERGEHEARAAALHLRGRGPDVQGARGEARRRRVGRQLGQQVVQVGLDQRDGHGSGPRRVDAPGPRAPARGWAGRAGRGCRRRSRPTRASGPAAARTRATSAATSAAPVGVTSSTSSSTPTSGAPRSSSSVAGAGSGRRPWAASTKPRADGQRRAHHAARRRSSSSASATPQTSPIASTAPDLVEVDALRVDAVHRPSATASRRKASWAREPRRAPAARRRRSARGWRPSRGAAGPRRRRTLTRVPAMPVPHRPLRRRAPGPRRRARRARARPPPRRRRRPAARPAACRPRRPPTQSTYSVRRHAAAPRRARDPRRDRPRPEAVVDADHGQPGRARGEHGEQGGDAAERRPVADAGRHADHRRGHEPAHDGGERGVLARHDHDAVRPLEVRERRRQAVQAGHAGVRVDDDLRAEQLGRARAPRCTTGPSEVPPETMVDQPARRRHRAGDPGQPRPLVHATRPGRRAAGRPGRPRRRA